MSIDAESSPRSGSALQRLEPPTAVSPTVRPLLTNITPTHDNVTTIKSFNSTRRLQGAQMVGGAPPEEVEMAMCDIATVFAKLTEIKANPDCTAGCAGGTGECPASWYPGRADMCSAECGVVFEPFCAPEPTRSSFGSALTQWNPESGLIRSSLTLQALRRGPMRPDAGRLGDGRHGRDVSLL